MPVDSNILANSVCYFINTCVIRIKSALCNIGSIKFMINFCSNTFKTNVDSASSLNKNSIVMSKAKSETRLGLKRPGMGFHWWQSMMGMI